MGTEGGNFLPLEILFSDLSLKEKETVHAGERHWQAIRKQTVRRWQQGDLEGVCVGGQMSMESSLQDVAHKADAMMFTGLWATKL